MSRLPIRLKLTLAFAGVMALLLSATGLFLYLRFADELDARTNDGLTSRADGLVLSLREDGGRVERGELAEEEQSFAQILDADGRVLEGVPPLTAPVLTAGELGRAQQGTVLLDRTALPASEGEESRLLAKPVRPGGQSLVVVVGASLDDRNDALESLGALLLIGGPLSLVLASAAGYGVASAALRPVESMRRHADGVSDTDLGQRLPVPAVDDEISRLGETLNAMLGRLESAFRRERAFVSDASHELRTPLAILRAELELSLRRGRSVEELEATIRSALEETDRVTQLADDLLLLARSDEGRLPIRRQSIELARLLNGVRDRFAARSHEVGRAIEVQAPVDLSFAADPLRLEQALGNVVDNALRHGRGKVRLSARPTNGVVELHVVDEGHGFGPEVLTRAFERFSRADPGRAGDGSGLGLAIVQAIARAHGGDAHVRNQGRGADVWLAIPKNGDSLVSAPGPQRPQPRA